MAGLRCSSLACSESQQSPFPPAGVHKCSVDCWVHPEQFRMQYSTGAPPDYFDRAGQNWGFPTYDWEAMAKDGYTWWRCRLKALSQ